LKYNSMVELKVKFEDQVNDENFVKLHDSFLFHLFLCGGGLFVFCVRLKMMNGSIWQVASSGNYFMISFHSVNTS
jgi:hypothetical protein